MLNETIYCCKSIDEKTNPPTLKVIHYAKTEKDAIEWLENNGGGIYHNLVHNFKMRVCSLKKV